MASRREKSFGPLGKLFVKEEDDDIRRDEKRHISPRLFVEGYSISGIRVPRECSQKRKKKETERERERRSGVPRPFRGSRKQGIFNVSTRRKETLAGYNYIGFWGGRSRGRGGRSKSRLGKQGVWSV